MTQPMRPETRVADLIDQLQRDRALSLEAWTELLADYTDADRLYAGGLARRAADAVFGDEIYMRALIEISNHCRRNCHYCGIRAGNTEVERYRLSLETIRATADRAYQLGYRTLVLQGGEDAWFTTDRVVDLVTCIKADHPDVAVTLSLGERPEADYRAFMEAGADRYLLREETADPEHYARLHPASMSMTARQDCLRTLKRLGYQTGCGFMVGTPGQGPKELAQDFVFIQSLAPHMIGVGPFMPHHATPFKDHPQGSFTLSLFCISLLRLLNPQLNLPATTAMGTIRPDGREQAILAGANVLMPNVTPTEPRALYTLYDNKICLDDDADACRDCLAGRLRRIGYRPSKGRGDYPLDATNDTESHGLAC